MTVFSRSRLKRIGVVGGRLRDCPFSPNCVCSDASSDDHRVPAFPLAVLPDREAWTAVRAVVSGLPRTRLVKATGDYLHAECRSWAFGFVDDLELHLRPEERAVAVRSASRLGYSDFGVNRARVARLRAELERRGVVAAIQDESAGAR